MLDRLLKFEEQLARLEALLLVVFVLLMLALATYNVLYRNILVPIQVSVLTDDTAATETADPERSAPPADIEATEEAEPTDEESGFGGGFGDSDDTAADESGGFGGGFGDTEEAEPEPTEKPPAEDAAGFGGGFGGDFDETESEPAAKPEPKPEAKKEEAGGFGGGFGGDFEDDAAGGDDSEGEGAAEGFGGGFGGDFEDGAADDAPAADSADAEAAPDVAEPAEPKEEPFIARLIDGMKLEWIDVLLRQFVLIVGFLGAMLATRRRKHITIDALSKVTPEGVMLWMNVLTNTVSIVICAFLTAAGLDLVQISIEFPKELMSWAQEWHFQLVFPVGFGLLVLHFGIRLIESLYYAFGKAEPRELATGGEA